ncbi:nucleotidyltransferase domain-containing protein [Clostridium sp. D53t1_180928_C8]|uniref:nucleotidyltransferase domain-containing protein n=1 Tax=Clostridium sp. D53t1_180928_C8 TaxID=2787101 RepID=UPI0018AC313E|nr:nucleotidyltransferase domain-containing protein [Clostridium sp. D53t1_180928_C8]
MGMNMIVYQIVNEFKRLDEVVAITLAGSCASGRKDNYSDIDIDIITKKDIPIEKRELIAKKFSDLMEINNNFWGTSDEFVLRNSSIQVDIAYFEFNWLKNQLENVVGRCNPSIGYTTCFWNNVINSLIVFDRYNEFKDLQEKYTVDYPEKLKQNIVNKNYPILKKNFSSYYNQIEKAINRKDLVNLNNRIAAFFDSYFDIIFAVNETPHPGEKRLLSIVNASCKKIPNNLLSSIDSLINNIPACNESILEDINNLVKELDIILKEENLIS